MVPKERAISILTGGALFCSQVCAPICLQYVYRFGDGCIMVWAEIQHGGRTALVHLSGAMTGIRYRDVSCCITSFCQRRNVSE